MLVKMVVPCACGVSIPGNVRVIDQKKKKSSLGKIKKKGRYMHGIQKKLWTKRKPVSRSKVV